MQRVLAGNRVAISFSNPLRRNITDHKKLTIFMLDESLIRFSKSNVLRPWRRSARVIFSLWYICLLTNRLNVGPVFLKIGKTGEE